MDGLVYRSSGVTLNWHIPAHEKEAREIQSIKFAWRCQGCGASGAGQTLGTAKICEVCQTSIGPDNVREFLEPSGFAVDFYGEPNNDITTQHFVPVESPWIDVRGNWLELGGRESIGRYRVCATSHVFHQSRGVNGAGYAICLACGRAEPMNSDGSRPAIFESPHRKLRGTSDGEGICRGSNDSWKVKEGLTLGHEAWTDAVEIQLRSRHQTWVNDRILAATLSVALRNTLASLIGVQSTELACDTKPTRASSGAQCQSIFIFDRFSAGYSTSFPKHLSSIFQAALKLLECPRECDAACPHCILDYDQRFAAESLNRFVGLEFLNDRLV